MMTAYVILWFLAGLSGCWLAHSISQAHPENLDNYQKPSDVFFALTGPVMLTIWVCIALEYALKRGGKE